VGLGCAFAVAAGAAFLKWKAPKPRNVFYIDGEMPSRALQERLIAIAVGCQAVPGIPDGNLRILPMDAQDLGTSINLADPSHQQAVERMLDDVEFLVLDNLSTLVNGGRENDAESWIGMQGWLLRLRRKGMGVLLIHHAGRGENARGTSKREDILDTVIHLKRPADYRVEEGARFEVHLTKARGIFGEEAAPFEARMEVRGGATSWTVRELNDVEAERVAEMTRDRMTTREIAEELGISKSKVNRIQNRLKGLDKAAEPSP
jgi:putative DNA primase/helicase